MAESLRIRPGNRDRDAVIRLAERQWGVVSRAQLLDAGLSKSAIGRWTDAGRLHRIHPGVYAVGHRALRTEGRLAAALFYAGPGAALSHATALWWWALKRGQPRTIHISAPGRTFSIATVHVHHPHIVERVFRDRLPVTPVARTLMDHATTASLDEVRRTLSEADYRGLLDVRELERRSGKGRAGSATMRMALQRHQPRFAHARSDLEIPLIRFCEHYGFPMPNINVIVAGCEVDAVWEENRVVVEVDGGPAHSGPDRMEKDRHWDLVLRARGYTILRYTWRQLTERTDEVAADLARALGQNQPTIPVSRGEVAEWLKALAC